MNRPLRRLAALALIIAAFGGAIMAKASKKPAPFKPSAPKPDPFKASSAKPSKEEAAEKKPSLRGKVPGFGGKTRRTYVGP